MQKLLIRADDFGFSEGINYGIEKSVKEGIIKNIGIMTNMQAVQHGINLLKGEQVCYGQHTNICVGKPLTDPDKIPSLTDDNGEFKSSNDYREAKEDFVVLEQVILEIEAQYKKFVELTGEKPHYFEGHAIASNNFFKGMQIVANKHNLRYCEMPFHNQAGSFGKSKIYIHMKSMEQNYNPFYSLTETVSNHLHEDGIDIFVCHPGYLDAYILEKSSLILPRPMEVKMLCDNKTKEWLKENSVELITYDEID